VGPEDLLEEDIKTVFSLYGEISELVITTNTALVHFKEIESAILVIMNQANDELMKLNRLQVTPYQRQPKPSENNPDSDQIREPEFAVYTIRSKWNC
jgi:RNA recognition motif-containing protein